MNALNTALQQSSAKETILSLPYQLKAQLPLSGALAQQICYGAYAADYVHAVCAVSGVYGVADYHRKAAGADRQPDRAIACVYRAGYAGADFSGAQLCHGDEPGN